jgi:hypothetical protein
MCGAAHAACGTASDSTPVDERIEEVAAVGGPLKKYEVTTPSGVKTTMKLNEDDARRLGVLDAPEQEGETQAPDQPAETETPSKSRSPRNKARTASSDKGDG